MNTTALQADATSPMFMGDSLVAFNIRTPRIWEVNINTIVNATSRFVLREGVVDTIIGGRTNVIIRFPVNAAVYDNEEEKLLNFLIGRGFKVEHVIVPQVGLYSKMVYMARPVA